VADTTLQDVLDGVLAKRRDADDWEGRGDGGWRASSLGACPRQQVLARIGVPTGKVFDARTLRIFALGDLLHDWVFDALEEAGWLVAREVRLSDPAREVVGHADGIIMDPAEQTQTVGVEVKTANSTTMRSVVEHGPKVEHCIQVGAYDLMAGAMPSARPDRWGLLYVGKDYGGMLEVPADPTWREAAEGVLDGLNDHWRSGMLPTCTCLAAYGGTGTFYCSYLDRDEDVKLVAAIGQAPSSVKKNEAHRIMCCARSPEGTVRAMKMWEGWKGQRHDGAVACEVCGKQGGHHPSCPLWRGEQKAKSDTGPDPLD